MEQLLKKLRDNSLSYETVLASDKDHLQKELRSIVLSDRYFNLIAQEEPVRTRLLELIADLYTSELAAREPDEDIKSKKVSDRDVEFISRLTQLAAT